MDRDTLERRLTVAISNLIVDDWRLLTTRTSGSAGLPVHEVAISFALGWHLKGVLERSWDVDCEYSRATTASGDVEVKRRPPVGRRDELAESKDDEVPLRWVRPDLIVHRRGSRGKKNNLLVLELKWNAVEQQHDGGSIESVLDVQSRYKYAHGVFLDLGLESGGLKPQWQWSAPDGTVTAPADVYQERSLRGLSVRARREEARRYRD